MKTRSGRSLARIDRDDLLQLAKIAAEGEARLSYSRATRRVRDVMPVGFSAGRSAREPPSTM